MANELHLHALTRDVDAWNTRRLLLREEGADVAPDLRYADLRNVSLHGADLSYALLTGAKIANSDLSKVYLWGANLERAEFCSTNLRGASFAGCEMDLAALLRCDVADGDFTGARLVSFSATETDFTRASFESAFISAASFRDIDAYEASFSFAALHNTTLTRVNVAGATFMKTTLGNVAFEDVLGLDETRHLGPSSVGIDTLLTNTTLSHRFLRGCGVPDHVLTHAASLAAHHIAYYSCFISYATADIEFATRLHADLQRNGIRTWFAPRDLQIGDRFRARIHDSIREHDKLVLVLSEASLDSPWVENEVETAFARERGEKRDILFPIRVDDAIFRTNRAWAEDVVNVRHVGDFSEWRNHVAYERAVKSLITNLQRMTIPHAVS